MLMNIILFRRAVIDVVKISKYICILCFNFNVFVFLAMMSLSVSPFICNNFFLNPKSSRGVLKKFDVSRNIMGVSSKFQGRLKILIILQLRLRSKLNPTSYGILRYHGGSHFGLYIAIDHLLTQTYRGHVPKF